MNSKAWNLLWGAAAILAGLYSLKTYTRVNERTVDFRYGYWKWIGEQFPKWWPGNPSGIRREDIERRLPVENLVSAIVFILFGIYEVIRSLR